jgi:hypothetical protein
MRHAAHTILPVWSMSIYVSITNGIGVSVDEHIEDGLREILRQCVIEHPIHDGVDAQHVQGIGVQFLLHQ